MTPSDKLREIAEKYKTGGYRIVNDYAGNKTMQRYDNENELLSDLTALISENYVEKAKYDELLRQRDELREKYSKLLDATSELLRSMKTDNVELKKSINEMAKNMAAEIAAIKNTDG